MKIALLTLPYDNNYGGNLQRYALYTVLHNMGHDVTHLNLQFYYHIPWYKYIARCFDKYILRKKIYVNKERRQMQRYRSLCSITLPFYDSYINHTAVITHRKQLLHYTNFDAFIVGSDQVWRACYGDARNKFLDIFFFSYLKNVSKKKIAFAVSFGTDESLYNKEEKYTYGELYKAFSAVSVRELSGLKLLKEYGWSSPKAIHLLDPTFLITQSEYKKIINSVTTCPSKGNLFCYILDYTDSINIIVSEIAQTKGLIPFYIHLNDNVSIQQWLRSFDEAKFVVTDSFHGLVFSLIFNKPFHLIQNPYRGNTRFESLCTTFHLGLNGERTDWDYINSRIIQYKNKALSFIEQNLK